MHAPFELSSGPLAWWSAMCSLSAFNIVFWAVAALAVRRTREQTDPALYAFRRRQLALSAIFVLVCAFRSVFPRADVQRICLHDTWLSSVMLGRSLATLAELCFAAQWALLLRQLGQDTDTPFPVTVSRLLVPLIALAEICSWYAVLTTSYLGNTLEESIWAVSALLATTSAATAWPRLSSRQRPLLAGGIGFGLAYVTFMLTVDVPMYISRWFVDRASGRTYLTFAEGLRDVSLRWVVTRGWEAWRSEVPWMSLYFTVTVWVSISLMNTPHLLRQPKRTRTSSAPAAVQAAISH